MQPERPAALIFRRRLLPWSETFIASQGRALSRYHPVFVGFDMVEAGEAYLRGADRVVLGEHTLLTPLHKAVLKTLGRMPRRWTGELRRRGPVIIHAHFGSNALDARPLAASFGIPLVATFHGADIAVRGSEKTRRRRRAVFEAADRIVAVSDFIRDRVVEAGCPPERVTVHRIGVDTDRFRPGPSGERDDGTILFVGRLVEKKGLTHLVQAMPAVRASVPSAEALVVGDGPLRPSLEAEAAELGVPVRFVGVKKPDEVASMMRRAAVLCFPGVVAGSGDTEGLGMTIVEAQASGTPAVIFPSGGSVEAVAHGETGFIAPARDVEALARHLVTLLTDRELRAEMGDAARRRVVESFDLRRQTARLEDLYDEVRAEVSRRGGPRVSRGARS